MIMGISTNGIGRTDVSSGSKQTKTKKDEGAADAFASLMNVVSTDTKTAAIDKKQDSTVTDISGSSKQDISQKENANPKPDTNKPDEADMAAGKPEADKVPAVKDTDSTKTENTEVKTDNAVNTEEEPEMDAVLLSKLQSAMLKITEVLTDALGISNEELDNMLSDMNMDIGDLLDPDALKSFLLKASDATEVDMLINEQLTTMISDVSSQIEAIASEGGEDFAEQLNDFVEGYVREQPATVADNQPAKKIVAADNIMEQTVTASESENVRTGEEPEETKSYTTNEEAESSIKADVSITSEGSSFSENKNQSSKDFSQNAAAILNNLEQAIDEAMDVEQPAETFTGRLNEADIVKQIIDDIKVNMSKEVTSLEMQLNPASLGKVQINIASKNGVMQAQILAETEAAKNAIENSIAELKESFNTHDLKVDAVEVMVASYEFGKGGDENQSERQEQRKTSGKGINLMDAGYDDTELSDEEQLEAKIMQTRGNSVSYSI